MYDELVKRLRNRRICIQQLGTLNDYPLLGEAADAIEELQATLCKWIPVSERLPEMNRSCLLYNKYYGPMVGARIDEMRFRIPGSRFPDTPTHWMPLPEPPKEES